jgi:hypothetical protein
MRKSQRAVAWPLCDLLPYRAGYREAVDSLQRRRLDTADSDELTIAMGIGLKRRSSLRVRVCGAWRHAEQGPVPC